MQVHPEQKKKLQQRATFNEKIQRNFLKIPEKREQDDRVSKDVETLSVLFHHSSEMPISSIFQTKTSFFTDFSRKPSKSRLEKLLFCRLTKLNSEEEEDFHMI